MKARCTNRWWQIAPVSLNPISALVHVLLIGLALHCGTGGAADGASAEGGNENTPPGSSGSPYPSGSSDASLSRDASGSTLSPEGSAPRGDSGSGAGPEAEAPSDAAGTTDHGNPDASVSLPPPEANRVRTVVSFDTGWLFNYGDATGASTAGLADTTWRQVHVPHDWSIEGPNPPASPFSQTAATTGRGGYVPSGISWYRKHFTLPQSLSGHQVFIEFDGVMENSDVYVNGTLLGHHPYGYTSLRYEMTSSVQFGTADNVIAVKTDTTLQPAERFFTGAGIYRHVRLIATDPLHVGQYATYVTTPAPTATAATVHVTTTVVNGGMAAASVSVQGVVSGPGGAALAPVTTAAQSIAAGAAASFTFDVPVSNPLLWDLTAPNMYRLLTNVLVGGTAVDDDVTPFGIREIAFNGGMTLNGKSVRFQGVANHQDFHGLGMAAPQRAMQRRLAQLKALGVNAIRTAHDPPSPDFLELTDRMGFLVLDEFADVWTAHKYSDVGDYATYFNQAATTPTGVPAVPTVTGVTSTGATWWQVDFTGWVMRDRNHPSVALYSMGNEIHDSIATRTPILTKMIAMSHALDPSRKDTQALLDPGTAGDLGGPTNTLLDVWGDNYNVPNSLTALASAPTKSSLLTEMGTEVSTWTTVTANPGLTGEFVWTGVDYLGEADLAWPQVGSTPGLMDALGTVRPIGYAWQPPWGLPMSRSPATGTTATQIVVAADHPTLVTDVNDISFIKATIADASGNVVAGSSAPVTFAITGPGTIVAVDSGSMTSETFRGNVRNAFAGIAFALVQATGAGTITVTAKSGTLTGGSATVTATQGAFVPCATASTCN